MAWVEGLGECDVPAAEGFAATRARLLARVRAEAPAHQERLRWSRDQVLAEQTRALRALLTHAAARSAFWRERLAGIDPATATPADLARVPVSTKEEVMARWDAAVTDPSLRRAEVDAWVAAQREWDYLRPDGLSAHSSGGSSGVRGVYLWDAATFVACAGVTSRHQVRDEAALPAPGRPPVKAVITAGRPPHASTPLFAASVDPAVRAVVLPADLPAAEMVRRLEAIDPTHLIGYPSVIGRMAEEQVEGRLRIRPVRVGTNSEPLLPEVREVMRRAWGAPVNNLWGSTETGIHAVGCDHHDGLHLNEDVVVVERVDAAGRPVADRAPAEKVIVTGLVNLTLPFIRYEITDSVSLLDEPCPCGSPFRLIADVQGRLDDDFRYGDALVPAVSFRHVLGADARIEEYQVVQTPRGADVRLVATGPVDAEGMAREIADALGQAGVGDPEVVVRVVDRLERNARTGKLKRFVPR
ncbi:MAG: phenylacetate--CoA ligase family protein [Thermoleophilia bacterium]|nr:phenylacetate--CoA ligase family protein [Thermoleophilia bacterium]